MRTCMDTYVCMYALRAADMHGRSGLVISHQQGTRYDAGFAVPVLRS